MSRNLSNLIDIVERIVKNFEKSTSIVLVKSNKIRLKSFNQTKKNVEVYLRPRVNNKIIMTALYHLHLGLIEVEELSKIRKNEKNQRLQKTIAILRRYLQDLLTQILQLDSSSSRKVLPMKQTSMSLRKKRKRSDEAFDSGGPISQIEPASKMRKIGPNETSMSQMNGIVVLERMPTLNLLKKREQLRERQKPESLLQMKRKRSDEILESGNRMSQTKMQAAKKQNTRTSEAIASPMSGELLQHKNAMIKPNILATVVLEKMSESNLCSDDFCSEQKPIETLTSLSDNTEKQQSTESQKGSNQNKEKTYVNSLSKTVAPMKNLMVPIIRILRAPLNMLQCSKGDNIVLGKIPFTSKIDTDEAKHKKDEAMKEKRNQLRELKDKQAREAIENLKVEGRGKLEAEEKGRLMQKMLGEQRHEAKKNRLAELQYLQDIEEKYQDQLRLMRRMQGQEAAEHELAESKRRKFEAQKRPIVKLKPISMSYKLDSEPDEDYDSDDESAGPEIPEWAKAAVRHKHLMMQRLVPNVAIQKYYDTQICTPDLTDLFPGISKSRIQRTSSAIWKTPPCFSIMSS